VPEPDPTLPFVLPTLRPSLARRTIGSHPCVYQPLTLHPCPTPTRDLIYAPSKNATLGFQQVTKKTQHITRLDIHLIGITNKYCSP
jgi:hypothetical protein